ncbi:C40 family peptidase [Solicola gregarius]|uniref:NlpC/P60 family protein n=1 Tax=Solicola gregarius TaxID=2908642 RepID=A0AA46TG63_9ACTN|nr:C40 family peptidase [Solicola gregarius]UYM04762.1 NlpC/P60 family protein [Solicola gregarius]
MQLTSFARAAAVTVVAGALIGSTSTTMSSAAPADAPPGGSLQPGDTAYVDVSVATAWVAPDTARPVDAQATGDPVDITGWVDTMTLAERRWLVGDLETQALFGAEVTVLQISGDWVEVAVHGQPTPRNDLGYPGWIPATQLRPAPRYGAAVDRAPFALVTATSTQLSRGRSGRAPMMDLSMNTRLPKLRRVGDAVKVSTPRGPAWVPAADVAVHHDEDDIPTPTGADIVRTAKKFLGLPYLWAGTSAFGFDCSGFTHTVYGVHGVRIPRDAGPQAEIGTPVAESDLRSGDLVFFGETRIHHVGIYAGDGYVIDAPTNSDTEESPLEYVPLKEHRYYWEYAGARRVLPSGQHPQPR